MLEFVNTDMADLPYILELFESSIVYQEKNGYPVWRNYDQQAIINDIREKRQYKGVVDKKIAIVFSLCYTDWIIWRHMDQGESVYLHRIVVNPDFKGQKLFGKILDWVTIHARERRLTSIRMDTWADNPTIRKYYQGFGFSFVENYTTPDTEELPAHNRKLALSLLEYKLT